MNIYSYNSTGTKTLIPFEYFTFSGGEEHIRLSHELLSDSVKVEIFDRLTDSSKIMRLMIAVDSLKRVISAYTPIELVIPYFPYARQDRVCVTGEAFGARVMANFINNLGFSKVTIWDAHSDVSPALLDRVENIEQVTILQKCAKLSNLLANGDITLISPDAGASKKTLKISQQFNGVPDIIQANKVRNLKTGEITKTEILGNVKGKHVLIVDDICDGGRTFVELAKELKAEGSLSITLFITHGIFSKGLEVFNGLIEHIYTTDSFTPAHEFIENENINLHIIEM